MNLTKQIQLALISKGFNCGKADGIMGRRTESAIIEFKKSVGLNPRAYVGPITLKALGIETKTKSINANTALIPWLNEMSKHMGLTEYDNALKKWLRSDGKSVGNPKDIPWCGDAIQTAVKISMPNEPFKDKVGKNPFLAANWLDFGEACEPAYGAIIVLWRGSPKSWKGHIAIIIGYDPKRDRYLIRGGNQSDKICDTWCNANRVRKNGFRVPLTFKGQLPPVPHMNSRGAIISTNEA